MSIKNDFLNQWKLKNSSNQVMMVLSVCRRVRIILGLIILLLVALQLIFGPNSIIFPSDSSIQFSLLIVPADNLTSGTLLSGRKFSSGHKVVCPKTAAEAAASPGFDGGRKTLGIWINSARENFARRQLIRKTWGSSKNYGGWSINPLVFVVGSHGDEGEDEDVGKNLEFEQKKFGDLVIGNFKDIYNSLTLKSTLAYEYFSEYCPNLQILVKADDDVFINIFQLTRSLNEQFPATSHKNRSSFYCYVHVKSKPYRRRWDKWYVSEKEFPGKYYENYCNGPAYVVTMAAVMKLRETLLTMKLDDYFRMEDVFTTGVLPSKFNSAVVEKYGKSAAQEAKIEQVHRGNDWYFGPVTLTGGSYDELRKWAQNERFDPTKNVHCEKSRQRRKNSGVTDDCKMNYASTIFFVMDSSASTFDNDFELLWTKVRQIEGLHLVD